MPFDARHLWWPPLQRLADSLLSASLDENIAGTIAAVRRQDSRSCISHNGRADFEGMLEG